MWTNLSFKKIISRFYVLVLLHPFCTFILRNMIDVTPFKKNRGSQVDKWIKQLSWSTFACRRSYVIPPAKAVNWLGNGWNGPIDSAILAPAGRNGPPLCGRCPAARSLQIHPTSRRWTIYLSPLKNGCIRVKQLIDVVNCKMISIHATAGLCDRLKFSQTSFICAGIILLNHFIRRRRNHYYFSITNFRSFIALMLMRNWFVNVYAALHWGLLNDHGFTVMENIISKSYNITLVVFTHLSNAKLQYYYYTY